MTVKIELTKGDKTVTLQISEAEIASSKDADILIALKVKNAIYTLERTQ